MFNLGIWGFDYRLTHTPDLGTTNAWQSPAVARKAVPAVSNP